MANSSVPCAVILGALGLWMFVPALLAASGRFTSGSLALTPDGIDYRSRGLNLWVGWDDIGALGDSWPMIVGVSTRNGRPVRHSTTAGWFTGEKLLTADFAVLRTDALSVHEHDLAPVLWWYVMTAADRAELGTPASLLRFDEPAHTRAPSREPHPVPGRTLRGRRGGRESGGTSSDLPPGRVS